MRAILTVVVVLFLPSWGWSAVLATKSGTLASAQATTGRSANQVDAQNNNNNVYGALTICYELVSGTSATVQIEYRQKAQSKWATVKSSSFPHGTSSLSVSFSYLALDKV